MRSPISDSRGLERKRRGGTKQMESLSSNRI